MMSNWKDKAATGMGWLIKIEQFSSVVLLATIVVTMGTQVISRYVFQSPISWSEEIARLAMIWLTFLSASFVAAGHQHIAVDLFGGDPPLADSTASQSQRPLDRQSIGQRLSPWLQILLSPRLVQILVLLTTLSLLIGGWRFVSRVYPVGSPGVGISMTYWYGAASVGLALISLHTVADLLGIRVSKPGSAQIVRSS